MKKLIAVVLLVIVGLTYYFVSVKGSSVKRWYTQNQVTNGKKLFTANCASCHGLNAEKTVNWRQTLPDGSYPPPALNGTAHAWHHPFEQLVSQIDDGGAQYGGKMPAFKDTLNEEEKKDVISYFQSFWNDKIYATWFKRSGL